MYKHSGSSMYLGYKFLVGKSTKNLDSSSNSKKPRKNKKRNFDVNRILSVLALFLCCVIFIQLFALNKNTVGAVKAEPFGLDNDFQNIVELNDRVSRVVPLPVESISLTHKTGDRRVIALYIFLAKYNSPMASISVAKAFVQGADKNGFGDKYQILPAISGIESGFGRIIPYNSEQISYNAWGWGGPGNWMYFNSWEDAALRISNGLGNGYGGTNMDPYKMVASYCPPCHKSGTAWPDHVTGYMNEIKEIEKSI